MEQRDIRIVRTAAGRYFWFVRQQNTIYCRQYGQEAAYDAVPVLTGVSGPFALYPSAQGEMYLLCREHFCRSRDGVHWDKRQVPELLGADSFFIVMEQGNLTFLYSLPGPGAHRLMKLTLRPDGAGEPSEIARFLPFSPEESFFVRQIAPNHFLLCYQTAAGRITARELLLHPMVLGAPQVVAETGQVFLDFTLGVTKDMLHIAYITRGRRGCQVVYRRKDGTGLNRPRVLRECREAHNCVLFANQGKLNVFWQEGLWGQYVASPDGGESFTRPVSMNPPLNPYVVKTAFLDGGPAVLWSAHALLDSRAGNLLLAGDLAVNP